MDDEYLGDGVYASTDGYMIKLTVDRGSGLEREVWLEPSVFAALQRYAEKVWGRQ